MGKLQCLATAGVTIALSFVTVSVAAEKPAGGRKASDLILMGKLPAITPEQRALTEVPWAKGAPAVVLLTAQQHEQQTSTEDITQRIDYFRRVKILTAEGAAAWASYEKTLYGNWRIQVLEARTVLPDGREIDAADGIVRRSVTGENAESDVKLLRVTWPEVRVGSILDLHLSVLVNGFPEAVWVVQDRIPVLDSRFVLLLPESGRANVAGRSSSEDRYSADDLSRKEKPGLQFRTLGVRLDPREIEPQTPRHPNGRAYIWSWENQPGVGDEPYAPPFEDAAKTLVVYPTALFEGRMQVEDLSKSWAGWTKAQAEAWDVWMKRKDNACADLARTVAAGKASGLEKAEAVRAAVYDRVRIRQREFAIYAPSIDDVLARGFGTSGEAAAVAASMLRAVDVPAVLVPYRRRSNGTLPTVAPLPVLMNDALVRVPGDKGPVYVSVSDPVPVGPLPPEARGANAIPLDGTATEPTKLASAVASDNRTSRIGKLTVDAAGNVSGELAATYRGGPAERWRSRFRGLDEAGRRAAVEDALRRTMPAAQVASLEIRNLDDLDKDLALNATWRAERGASTAGAKVSVNLNIFAREAPENWEAETRVIDLDFGEPYETTDVVSLTLPEGALDVALPAATNISAPPVGRFAASYSRGGRVVAYRRQERIDQSRVAATAYASLRPYFLEVARSDGLALVVTMP